MPVYEFRCKDCQRNFALTVASIAQAEMLQPECPRCNSTRISRLIRRVAILTGEEARLERLADPSRFSGLDEDDPRAMGRAMREMAAEMGEDAGPELNQVIERLEAGESPESIEQSMGSELGSEADL